MKVLEQLIKFKNEEEIAKFSGGNLDKIWSYIIIYNQAKAIFKKFDDCPNIKINQESTISVLDYFTLNERGPQIDFIQNNEILPRDQIQGRIETKGFFYFSYSSALNHRMVLKNLNLVINSGKKVTLIGESGCGKK